MAVVTLDDYLAEVRELLELVEDVEVSIPKSHAGQIKMLRLGIQRIEAQLAAGEKSRRKLRDHHARKKRLSTGAAVPLWGGE